MDNVKNYRISLKIKEGRDKLLPYKIDSFWVYVPAENLIEACEKAEVYFSGIFGISMIAESGHEEFDYMEGDKGAPGEDITND